jgi:transposase
MSRQKASTSVSTTPIDAARVEALLRKLRAGAALDGAELSLVADIVESWAHLSERAQRFDLSLSDLRKMLGVLGRGPGGKRSGSGSGGAQGGSQGAPQGGGSGPLPGLPGASLAEGADEVEPEADPMPVAAPDADVGAESEEARPETNADPATRNNHGRRGADDFAHLPCVQHTHHDLAPGCMCPTCQQGRLYRFYARTFVTISGQAPFVGHRHAVERLQCNVCASIFEAALPDSLRDDGVGNGKLYSHSAHTAVVLLKYLGVMPWHRQQTLQSAMGVMVPDACMWDMCEALCAVVRPVVSALELLAGASPLLYGDDTTAAIFGLKSEVKLDRTTGQEVERTGCHTTAVIARTAEGRHVAVFRVGIQHTGELMDEILRQRPAGLLPPMVMADASSSNGVTVCQVHMCGCNAHALRRFKALEDKYPTELAGILSAYRAIYQHDAHTRSNNMDDEARLAYHRQYSRPLFRQMCRDAHALLDAHKVEPNSTLGSELDYLLNHQRRLSAFYRLPGAPIDNNLAERELRLSVRLRDAAPMFRSRVGAAVAAHLWTLLVTTLLNDANAFDYLNALQRHASEVLREPLAWLPWNYRRRAALCDRASPATSPPKAGSTEPRGEWTSNSPPSLN